MLPIIMDIKKPRKLKSGRFETRHALISYIADKYYGTDLKQAQIARTCEVSETTVASLLESQELKDYRRFKELDKASRPVYVIWPTKDANDRIMCQSRSDYVRELENILLPLHKIQTVTPTGHPELISPTQAQRLYTDSLSGKTDE